MEGLAIGGRGEGLEEEGGGGVVMENAEREGYEWGRVKCERWK